MRIAAVEHALPSTRVTNDMVVNELLERSHGHLNPISAELVKRLTQVLFKKSKTSIRYRRSNDEKAIDFGMDAALHALAAAEMTPNDIDLLIYVGVGRGFLEPATANVFQHELGMARSTCFDVLDACASWMRGFDIARSFIKAGQYRSIMVLSCEMNTKEYGRPVISDPRQLTHYYPTLTIGEAATATILVADDADDEYYSTFRSDGSNHLLCQIPLPNLENYTYRQKLEDARPLEFYSYGEELFEQVFEDLTEHYRDSPEINALAPDLVLSHAASDAMTERVMKAIGLPPELAYYTHMNYGNTVSSSVPLALSLASKDNRLKRGDRILFGFGSAGTTTVWTRFRY